MTMTREEYQVHINWVKDRYPELNLTFEQAEKVFKYVKDKDTYSDKHYFSAWEEWDYELSTFKEILNADQFKKYQTVLNENIQRYEQSLIELDNDKTNEIAYCEEQINFYETQVLPDFFKEPIIRMSLFINDKSKIKYLKEQYKHFLNETKKEILVNHFRHNRTFKPKELQVALLRHKLSYIFPDYNFFKHQMDKPTKAVASFLYSKLHFLPDTVEELLTQKTSEIKLFHEGLIQKNYGGLKGWHVATGKQTLEAEKELRTMTLLLLDEGRYGC